MVVMLNDPVVVVHKEFGELRQFETFKWCGIRYMKIRLVDGEWIAKPLPHQGTPKPLARSLGEHAVVEIEVERAHITDYERFMAKWRAKKGEWIKDGF